MRNTLISLLVWLAATTVSAAPTAYVLDNAASAVGFSVMLGNDQLTGTMPVASADLQLDLAHVANSRVSVTLSAQDAQMSAIFAVTALKDANLLDTATYPAIRFVSTTVAPGATLSEAIITGNVTIKGVTRPITLAGKLTQDASTVGQDNPPLQLLLTGQVNRNDFGASGYAAFVGPTVTLRILTTIRRR